MTQLKLEAGDCVLLISDGVTGGQGDQWVRDLLAGFDGGSPRALAQQILDESGSRAGTEDDRTALVIRLSRMVKRERPLRAQKQQLRNQKENRKGPAAK